MKMLLFLIICTLLADIASAISIGVSPDKLDIKKEGKLTLINPNNHDVTFKITPESFEKNIVISTDSGVIGKNSRKTVNIKAYGSFSTMLLIEFPGKHLTPAVAVPVYADNMKP